LRFDASAAIDADHKPHPGKPDLRYNAASVSSEAVRSSPLTFIEFSRSALRFARPVSISLSREPVGGDAVAWTRASPVTGQSPAPNRSFLLRLDLA
jgi:hypothetical protein